MACPSPDEMIVVISYPLESSFYEALSCFNIMYCKSYRYRCLSNEVWLWNLTYRRDLFVLKNELVVNLMETMEGCNGSLKNNR